MGLRYLTVFVSVLMAFGSASAFYSADGSSSLQAELRRHYKLAMAKVEGKDALVVEAGQNLAIRKEGIVAFGKEDSSFADLCPSQFVNGELRASQSPACTTLAPANRKVFRLLQPVCVTSLDVADENDSVSLSVIGCDASNRVRFNDAYRAKLIFVFPKGSLVRSAPSRIENVIGQVLSPSNSSAASAAKSGDASSTTTGSANPGGEAPPAKAPDNTGSSGVGNAEPDGTGASAPDPAKEPAGGGTGAPSPVEASNPAQPPTANDKPQIGSGNARADCPPPAVSSDSTARPASEPPPESRIGIGQTIDQVKAILGPPKTTSAHGRKIIFRYPKLKVVFVDGTVSAVEKSDPR